MAGAAEEIYRAFYDTPHIQEQMRIYAQNKEVFRLLAIRNVVPLSLLTVISQKFSVVPASMITDWQMRYQEFDELPYTFTCQDISGYASVGPASGSLIDYVKLTNKAAAGLHTGHRLLCSLSYSAGDITTATTTNCSATWDATNAYLNEVVRILAVGDRDGSLDGKPAATGYSWVKIKRAHPATAVTGTLHKLPSGNTLTLVNSVARTNQRPFPPVTANGKTLYNAVQITRESYGIGEHLTQGGGIETMLQSDGQAYLGLNFELCEKRFMKTIERAILTGRRVLSELENESEYETGGILQFIPTENYLNVNGIITESSMNYIVAQAIEKSGVRELWMFGDTTFTRLLADAYTGKRLFGIEQNMSLKYGMKVYSLEGTGLDGIVYYVNAPVLNQVGLNKQAIILNLTEYNYGEKSKYGCFQIAEKVPVRDDPKDAQSYSSNEGFKGTHRELYYAWGLIRRLPETHFRVYGVTG